MRRMILLSSAALAVLLGTAPVQAQTASGSDKTASPLTVPNNVRRVGSKDWPDAKPGTEIKPETKTTSTVKTDPLSLDGSATAKKDSTSNPLATAPIAPVPGKFEAAQTGSAKPETTGTATATESTAVKSQPAAQPTAKISATVEPDGAASIRLGTDASGHVAINAEQERQIGAAMRKQNAEPAEVHFDVKVGAAVPESVRLGAVSRDVVDVLPQFRGYSFFATREEIVIVEPSTKKIVALLPVRVTATAARPGATKRRAASNSGEVSRQGPAIAERETVGAGPGPDRIVIESYDARTQSRGYRTLDPSDNSQVIIRRVPRGQIFEDDDD